MRSNMETTILFLFLGVLATTTPFCRAWVPAPRHTSIEAIHTGVTTSSLLAGNDDENLTTGDVCYSRRDTISRTLQKATALLLVGSSISPKPAVADDSFLFERDLEKKLSYKIQIPESMKQTQKPVKTHLDEVNFVSDTVKGYQFGITVDPVRINSLKEFGTPEQVAARVVTAEVNRDGIFEVKLLKDPIESSDGGYILEYLSIGKRGDKHFINKIVIANNLLYVLTAQAKEEIYKDDTALQEEMNTTVDSFRV